MQVRDLYAACVGFVAACALFAVQRYLVEPTLVTALLLVTSGIAFVVAVTTYAAAVASREGAPQRAPLGHRAHDSSYVNGNAERPGSIPVAARSSRTSRKQATA